MTRLGDLATVRTKNVSPFEFSIDVFCADAESYARLTSDERLSAAVAEVFGTDERDWVYSTFAPALAIKFTIPRTVEAGGVGDWDLFGAGQAVPLQDFDL